MKRTIITMGTTLACAGTAGWAQTIPAFSGADGAAANVTGGRGGTVYHVTRVDQSMNDNAVGTLRYGLSLTGPRTIVFDVAGHFNLGRVVSGWDGNGNGWDTQSRLTIPSNVTIAGQTAPGPVILHGGVIKPSGSNIILRNITIAAGYGNRGFYEPTKPMVAGTFPSSYVYDALDISGQNVMIDHVSTVYGTDETVSMNELANNVTIQYSNISQGQNYPQADAEATGTVYTGHALGSLLQAGSNAKISVHHNLYAHQKGRLPRVGTEASKLTVAGVGAFNDFRNNVFYNWLGTAGTGASGQASQNNFIANFFLAGDGGDNPVGGSSSALATAAGGTGIFSGGDSTLTKVFHSGNLKDINKDADSNDTVTLTNGDFASSAIQGAAFAQSPYTGITDDAATAYNRVLNYVGASWWNRSAIDQRIIAEVRNGTGKIMAWADDPFNADPAEGTEWRALVNMATSTRAAGFDTDADGLPDTWEAARGLHPLVASNNDDYDGDGYTNLEEYINDLAAWPASRPIVFSGGAMNGRYALISNWDIAWQPSRYDVAKINTGTAVVDAIDQHAGTLLVGTDVGSNGTLAVTGGWIEVEALRVGGTAGRSGAVTLSGGGVVRASNLVRIGETGSVAFNGGSIDLAGIMVVDYAGGAPSPLQSLRAQIKSGRSNGTGLVSIAAASMSGVGIGIAEASAIGATVFGGEQVDLTTILISVTYLGDSNLDRRVDFDDLLRLAQHYGMSAGGTWTDGDFNYDDAVSFDDLLALAQNYGRAGATLVLPASVSEHLAADWALAQAMIPEPTAVAALAAAAASLGRRGRR